MPVSAAVAEDASTEIINAERAARVWSLFVDQLTASITARLEARQIKSILIKGPAFAHLLYDRNGDRFYTDTDLLVKSADRMGAEQLLEEIGFVRVDRDEDWIGPEPKYAHTFQRRDGAMVDLHWRLSGITAPTEELWPAISAHVMKLEVGGRLLDALDAPANALVAALHNAHHGSGRATALSDLDRAVDRLDVAVWVDAMCLADQLGAAETFAAGLRLTGAGDALADRLGLHRPASVEMWLKTNPSTYGAWVIDRLTQTSSLGGRLRICLAVVVPPRVVMYRFFPLARRGRIGLVLAYMLRPPRLAAHAVPALREWMRAHRALRAR